MKFFYKSDHATFFLKIKRVYIYIIICALETYIRRKH